MRRHWRRLIGLVASLSIIAASVVVALVVVKRLRTGVWAAPGVDDVRALRKDLVRVKAKVLGDELAPSKTIFLERGRVELTAGSDDAATGASSVVASGAKRRVVTAGFRGSKRTWTKIVACVRDQFRDFDVVVTDERPEHGEFMMAVIGGRSRDIGVKSHHVGGLAPFNGRVIPRAVVFAFAGKLGNRVRAVCETAAMEIGHAYGLDHAYHCPDVMTYLRGCGRKRFRDKPVACGEHKKRACEGGAASQSSYRRLLDILGARLAASE